MHPLQHCCSKHVIIEGRAEILENQIEVAQVDIFKKNKTDIYIINVRQMRKYIKVPYICWIWPPLWSLDRSMHN